MGYYKGLVNKRCFKFTCFLFHSKLNSQAIMLITPSGDLKYLLFVR